MSQLTDLPPLFALAEQDRSARATTFRPIPRATETAASVSSGRKERILQFIVNNGPSTLDEMCTAFEVAPNQISGRVFELKRDLLIEEIGLERPSRSGCACQVYDITRRGREALNGRKL